MSNTINKTFKKYRVCLDTRCNSIVEVVCRDEDDLWDILRSEVSYKDYNNNMVGMSVSSDTIGDTDYTPTIRVVREYQYDGEINSSIEEEEDLVVEFDPEDFNTYWGDEEEEDYE